MKGYRLQCTPAPLCVRLKSTRCENRTVSVPGTEMKWSARLKRLPFSTCNLTAQSCESLSLVLQSSTSCLRELDLSKNDLKGSGVKLLSDGLKNLFCVQLLCLSRSDFPCCESLSSALQSSTSVLKELDLSNNGLQDSGVKLLSDGLKSPNCKLEILRFDFKQFFFACT
uniref:SPRY-associated domain-containing protein n=1 Tax=Sinocyclocheilus anshuiensis TaxID=1608454 RepID=A0A671K5W4_9TELE